MIPDSDRAISSGKSTEREAREIGARGREARKILGLTLDELAVLVRVRKGTLSEWENGHHLPRPHHLRQWASELGVRPEWLISAIEPMKATGLDIESFLNG